MKFLQKLAVHAAKEGQPDLALTAVHWAQDRASISTARDLLLGVEIGDHDFTQKCDCCDDED